MTFPVLEGKVAIVTRAAMGMGEATAKLFAEAGAKVAGADFNVEHGERVVAEIEAVGRGALEQFGLDPNEYAAQLSLLNRFGQAEEIAQASLCLASDLSSYATGTTLHVDAGYTSQ